jgi:hypothetical protein
VKHAAAGSAGRRRPRLAQLPYLLVLAGAGAALGVIALGPRRVQGGTLVLAGVLLAAALARLLLPDRRAGMLGTRRRVVDVLTLGALGAGLLVAGLVLPPPG